MRNKSASLACALVCASALFLVLLPGTVRAQTDPTFEFAKPEAVKAVEWKAQVKGGFVTTTGNSQTKGGTFGATASRKEGGNKLSLDANAAYGQSNVRTPVLDMTVTPNTITAIDRTSIVTTNNWLAKARYDRFFTANNAGYVSAQAAADKIAGKSFYGGGQVGYSRQLVNNGMHLLVAEIGYDLSHERYMQQPMKTLDPVTIHSARVFAGETLKITDATGATASVEALFNLNSEKTLNASNGMSGVDAFKDTRVIGKVGVTTTLVKRLSVGLGFTLKYDQNPAVLPIPSGAPSGAIFAPNFTPFAEKVDTLFEANLIYTLL